MPRAHALTREWFAGDTRTIARELIGCHLCRRLPDGRVQRLVIAETEAYDGPEDLASHAKGNRKTTRNAVMFEGGGLSYVYLCYGIHWLLNFVTGPADYPAAVLIRGAGPWDGPGKLTKALAIDGSANHRELISANGLWVERREQALPDTYQILAAPRIGVDYAGPYWSQVPFRFTLRRSRNW